MSVLYYHLLSPGRLVQLEVEGEKAWAVPAVFAYQRSSHYRDRKGVERATTGLMRAARIAQLWAVHFSQAGVEPKYFFILSQDEQSKKKPPADVTVYEVNRSIRGGEAGDVIFCDTPSLGRCAGWLDAQGVVRRMRLSGGHGGGHEVWLENLDPAGNYSYSVWAA